MFKKFKKFIPILVIAILSLIAFIFELQNYLSFELLEKYKHHIDNFITHNFIISVSIYVITYIIITSLAIPAATFMTLAGGIFFGFFACLPCVVFASTIGASILFISTKGASQDFVMSKNEGIIKNMQQGFKKNAFLYLMSLRLMPFMPFFIVNLASAFFQVPLRIFFIATFIGIIPISCIYTQLGVSIGNSFEKPYFSIELFLEPEMIASFIGLSILSLIPFLYKKYNQKKLTD